MSLSVTTLERSGFVAEVDNNFIRAGAQSPGLAKAARPGAPRHKVRTWSSGESVVKRVVADVFV